MAITNQIQIRRGTASSWSTTNPTLAVGEPGFVTDLKRLKIGDGTTTWNSLAYVSPTIDLSDNVTASTFRSGGISAATAATFTFGSDLNTGMFSPDYDNVAFTTLGTERLRIDDTGKVGIGTVDPLATLDVNGGVIATGLTVNGVDLTYGGQSPSTNLKGYTWFGAADGSDGIACAMNFAGLFDSSVDFPTFTGINETVTAYNPICFTAGYFAQVYMHTNGNVGINTANPTSKLHVNGDATVTGNLTANNILNYVNFSTFTLGPTVNFVKANYAATVDTIISGQLALARGNNGGLYNSVLEALWNGNGPTNTLWNSDGWANLSNITGRTFTSFAEALDNQVGNSIVPAELVMLHVPSGRYWKMDFSAWTQGGGGGGFQYDRTEILISDTYKYYDNSLRANKLVASSNLGINDTSLSESQLINIINGGNLYLWSNFR